MKKVIVLLLLLQTICFAYNDLEPVRKFTVFYYTSNMSLPKIPMRVISQIECVQVDTDPFNKDLLILRINKEMVYKVEQEVTYE